MRKKEFLILVLAVLIRLRGVMSSTDCVNVWDADLTDSSAQICPVMTDSGQNCQLPFTYNGIEYNSCIIAGPNNPDSLPQCMTTTQTWSFCKGKLNHCFYFKYIFKMSTKYQ